MLRRDGLLCGSRRNRSTVVRSNKVGARRLQDGWERTSESVVGGRCKRSRCDGGGESDEEVDVGCKYWPASSYRMIRRRTITSRWGKGAWWWNLEGRGKRGGLVWRLLAEVVLSAVVRGLGKKDECVVVEKVEYDAAAG